MITQKQLEELVLHALISLLIFALAFYFIIPGISFVKYFILEISIVGGLALSKFMVNMKR